MTNGNWKPIKTAPKDGTVIRVRNPMMRKPVLAKYAQWRSSHAFVTAEPWGEFNHIQPGTLVMPTEWQAASALSQHERKAQP